VTRATIRALDPATDLEPVVVANDAVGWKNRRGMVAFYVGRPDSVLFVADVGGAIAGTGGATVFPGTPPTGWVHGIVVSPEHQRAGHGAALTEAAIRWLHARSVRTVLLLATGAGRPLYERLGFVAWEGYRSFDWPKDGSDADGVRVRRMTAADLDAVNRLDRVATGEDRSAFISTLASTGWIAERDGAVAGFHLACSWGGGPTIAGDAATGIALIRHSARLQAEPPPRPLGVPETNAAACAYLNDGGLATERYVTRMTLGPPIAWRPEMIFGVFNYAVA
jgi:GNAT superfamily N-acetyltransferase